MRRWLRRAVDFLLGPLTRRHDARLAPLRTALHRQTMLLAATRLDALRARPHATLREWEFSVFSQWGQDGIIQFLLSRVPIGRRRFVEFGVQDYAEASTRFLLEHDDWSGLVLDPSADNLAAIRVQEFCWRHELTAECAFVTRENVNALLGTHMTGDLGLLVIDVDGNDYWIWEALDVVSPRIVACEYNSLFGAEHAVAVPYRADFDRSAAHFSNLYFGASLPALCRLAARKGYRFVGCNRHGNDAFFVREDVAANVPAVSVADGYVESKSREARDAEGRLTFASGAARRQLIGELEVFDLAHNRLRKVSEL